MDISNVFVKYNIEILTEHTRSCSLPMHISRQQHNHQTCTSFTIAASGLHKLILQQVVLFKFSSSVRNVKIATHALELLAEYIYLLVNFIFVT